MSDWVKWGNVRYWGNSLRSGMLQLHTVASSHPHTLHPHSLTAPSYPHSFTAVAADPWNFRPTRLKITFLPGARISPHPRFLPHFLTAIQFSGTAGPFPSGRTSKAQDHISARAPTEYPFFEYHFRPPKCPLGHQGCREVTEVTASVPDDMTSKAASSGLPQALPTSPNSPSN